MMLMRKHANPLPDQATLKTSTTNIRRRGFTLIEMLLVTSLIVLLVALLLPALSKARIGTQLTVCQTRQRMIGNALTSYAVSESSRYPTATNDSGHFADSYDLRRAHPYGGAADRPALGIGLPVSTGHLSGNLGQIVHCPSFDNSQGATWNGSPGFAPNHCMDAQSAWGFGGSGWNEYPQHRIIGSYSYRGTSYQGVNGPPPSTRIAGDNFVTLMDLGDQRFRGEQSENNAHGGYNLTFGDGSVYFLEDANDEVDFMVKAGGGTMNGRHSKVNDEAIYYYMGDQR